MKKTIILLNLILVSLISTAQVANPSFETWESPLLTNSFNVSATVPVPGLGNIPVYLCANFSYNELTNWSSTNQITKGDDFGDTELVTESSNAYSGTKSVKIESKAITLRGYIGAGCVGLNQTLDHVAPGLIVSGSFSVDAQVLIDDLIGGSGLNALNPFTYEGAGEPIDFTPKSISGYYEYTGAMDTTGQLDSFIVVSGLKKNGVIIGYATERFGNTTGGFTQFSVDYTYLNCETPDTIVTVLSSSSLDFAIVNGEFIMNTNYTGVDGSVLYLDALHLDTILPSEYPPFLNDDNSTIFIDNMATVDVLDNDEFCDGNALTPIIVYTGSEGTVSLNSSNEIEFTPNSGYQGTVNFYYYACNTASICDTAYVQIDVIPFALCNALDDNYNVNIGSTTNDNPKLNDDDCGTTLSIVTQPFQGTATVESNNSITYAPNSSSLNVDTVIYDTLTYKICSNVDLTQCDTATIKYAITIVSGIQELNNSLIKFYPNPAKNTLNISVESLKSISVTIFNTIGEKVITDTFENSQIFNLNSLNNGIYFVEIETDGKKSIKKLQVIK